jgi:hypothetical protein
VTPRTRDRLATPVVLLYWLLVAIGLGMYGLIVSTNALLPLALGSLLGGVLGHVLALRDVRTWLVVALLVFVVYIGVPLAADAVVPREFWMAFVPAALCAYASLAERWSLAALWFPVVLWMLTILDRTRGVRALDDLGLALLGVLAVSFVAFLRARETRRVGLWRTVGATPLAIAEPVLVRREARPRMLARAAWSLGTIAATIAVTAVIGPKLWQLETARAHRPAAVAQSGLPCCHPEERVDRTRVREYLDLGRGTETGQDKWNSCKPCRSGRGHLSWDVAYGDYPEVYAPPTELSVPPGDYNSAAPGPSGSYSGSIAAGEPSYTRPSIPHEEVAPTYSPPPITPPSNLASPPPVVTPPPAPVPPPAPAPARVEPPPPPLPAPTPVAPTPPPPTPPPAPAEHPPASAMAPAASAPPIEPQGEGDRRTQILYALVLLVAGAVLYQVIALLLRPVRRAVTLRHLRKPFWDETVDQRISNSWQLALVGLRDAGWRHDAGEAPRDLAQRTGIAGMERCATILERARYGVGITDGDLSEMSTTADAVYRQAHANASPMARAVSWLRWPLA